MTDVHTDLADFLNARCRQPRTLVLGLSGGADSLALFKLLLRYRQQYPIQLIAVHCDHGWRSTSVQEAQRVAALCAEHTVPCEVVRLPPPVTGNLEAHARHARLEAFQRVSIQHDAQAVLLAHHADDQAESVLKAVLEGKPLTSMRAMQPVSRVGALELWRPLLHLTKQQLAETTAPALMEPIEDSSNQDPRFLRSRMRTHLLPELETAFGKSVQQPLIRLSRQAAQLEQYLDRQTAGHLEQVATGPWGAAIPLKFNELHPLELEHVLRRMLESRGVEPSFQLIDRLVSMITEGHNGQRLEVSGVRAERSRDHVYLLNHRLPRWKPIAALREGVRQMGEWEVAVEPASEMCAPSDWRSVWRGQAYLYLPVGEYVCVPRQELTERGAGRQVGDLWTASAVPRWMRELVPLVACDGRVVGDFLSGRQILQSSDAPFWRVSLTLKNPGRNPVGIIRPLDSIEDCDTVST